MNMERYLDYLLDVYFLAGATVVSLFAAFFLRAAAKWTAKLDVSFGSAIITGFLVVFLDYFLLQTVAHFIWEAVWREPDGWRTVNNWQMGTAPFCFLFQSLIISIRHKLSFGKSCVVSLAMFGVAIGVTLIALMVFYPIFKPLI